MSALLCHISAKAWPSPNHYAGLDSDGSIRKLDATIEFHASVTPYRRATRSWHDEVAANALEVPAARASEE
eukprot:2402212-Amphidinium_carterae.1